MSFADPADIGGGFNRRQPAGGLVGFAIFVSSGMIILAGAVLLPEYAALAALRARRDALAHQVRCEERLADYHDRMIRASRNDPVLVTRLMIRHGNYRPIGCQTLAIESAPPVRSVPERLLHEARNPPASAEENPPVRAGRWLNDPATIAMLTILALAAVAAGAVLFRPASLK